MQRGHDGVKDGAEYMKPKSRNKHEDRVSDGEKIGENNNNKEEEDSQELSSSQGVEVLNELVDNVPATSSVLGQVLKGSWLVQNNFKELREDTHELQYIASLLSVRGRNVSVAVVGAKSSGKTTLVNSLINNSQTFSEGDGLVSSTLYKVEKARRTTLYSSLTSTLLQSPEGEHVVVSLQDTPGHSTLFGELERSYLLTDVAILVIDIAEGVTLATRTCLKILIRQQKPIVLFINKLDRIILGMRVPPRGLYWGLKKCVVDMNEAAREIIRELYGVTTNRKEVKGEEFFDPSQNIVFGSALHGWAMTLQDVYHVSLDRGMEKAAKHRVTKRYEDTNRTMMMSPEVFAKSVWDDTFFNPETRTFQHNPVVLPVQERVKRESNDGNVATQHNNKRNAKMSGNIPNDFSFVEFVLEPIYRTYATCISSLGANDRRDTITGQMIDRARNVSQLFEEEFSTLFPLATSFATLMLCLASTTETPPSELSEIKKGEVTLGTDDTNDIQGGNNKVLVSISSLSPTLCLCRSLQQTNSNTPDPKETATSQGEASTNMIVFPLKLYLEKHNTKHIWIEIPHAYMFVGQCIVRVMELPIGVPFVARRDVFYYEEESVISSEDMIGEYPNELTRGRATVFPLKVGVYSTQRSERWIPMPLSPIPQSSRLYGTHNQIMFPTVYISMRQINNGQTSKYIDNVLSTYSGVPYESEASNSMSLYNSVSYVVDMFPPMCTWKSDREGLGVNNGSHSDKRGMTSYFGLAHEGEKIGVVTVQSVGEFQLDVMMEEMKKNLSERLVFITGTQTNLLYEDELVPVTIEIMSSKIQPILHEGCFGPPLMWNEKTKDISELIVGNKKSNQHHYSTSVSPESSSSDMSVKLSVVAQSRNHSLLVKQSTRMVEVSSNILMDATVDNDDVCSGHQQHVTSDGNKTSLTSLNAIQREMRVAKQYSPLHQYLQCILGALVSGFAMLCEAGPTLGLPCEEVRVFLIGVSFPLSPKLLKGKNINRSLQRLHNNLASMMRDVCAGAVMLARPCVYEIRFLGGFLLPGGIEMFRALNETTRRFLSNTRGGKSNAGNNQLIQLLDRMRSRILKVSGVVNTPFTDILIDISSFDSLGITTKTLLSERMVENGNSSGDRIFSRIQLVPSYWSPVPINEKQRHHKTKGASIGWEFYSKLQGRKASNEDWEKGEGIDPINKKMRNGVVLDWSLIGGDVEAILKSNKRATHVITTNPPV